MTGSSDAAGSEPQPQPQLDLEEAVKNQQEKQALLSEIQQLKEQLSEEQALRVKQ